MRGAIQQRLGARGVSTDSRQKNAHFGHVLRRAHISSRPVAGHDAPPAHCRRGRERAGCTRACDYELKATGRTRASATLRCGANAHTAQRAAMDKPQIIEHVNKSVNYTIFDAKWVCSRPARRLSPRAGAEQRARRGAGLACARHGRAPSLQPGRRRSQAAHRRCPSEPSRRVDGPQIQKPSAFKCGTFAGSSLASRHLATGDFAGHLMVWCVSPGVGACVM